MRDKGVNYHLNWGATIPRLKDKAEDYKDRHPNIVGYRIEEE